ncbi:MAG: hypothetical protein JW795_20110 [Chitinivibrionales bacterium]|nr:hypothetical protein [Chitinivibrionales bacterium]
MKKGRLFQLLMVALVAVCTVAWSDVVLDDFQNKFGDESSQNAIGAEYGLKKFGPDSVDMGGGYWYTIVDDSGSAIFNNKFEEINALNFNTLVENKVLQVILTTGKNVGYAYAQVECPFMLEASSTNPMKDTNWFNFQKLEKVGVRIKGKGQIRIEITTADIDSLAEEDRWGYYGYKHRLNQDWTDLTIEASKLTPDVDSKAKNNNWGWDHGRNRAKCFAFSIVDDGVINTPETASVFIEKIVLYGLNATEVFGFQTPITQQNVSFQKTAPFSVCPLSQNRLEIRYTVAFPQAVSLAICNLQGRLLSWLHAPGATVGMHTVIIDNTRPLSSGRYYVRLIRNGVPAIQPFSIVK